MQDNYIYMQDNYACMQDIYVYMQDYYVYCDDIQACFRYKMYFFNWASNLYSSENGGPLHTQSNQQYHTLSRWRTCQ